MNQYEPTSSDHFREEVHTPAPRSRRRGAARPRHTAGQESGEAAFRRPESYERSEGSNFGERTERKKKHPLRTLFLFIVLAAVAAAGWLGYKIFAGGGSGAQAGYYTVAVFGLDSRNGNVSKEALSDVNVIARFDMASGEIKLVSLYRDTYSQISADGAFHKLNEAYFKGGPEQAVWAVEHNTDVKVDDYAAFNWKAIVDAINILGGIDLEITDAEFRYINAFITETVNSTGVGSYQLEHAGMNHLDGVQAVAYARLRLMDTDFNRTERQRKVVKLAFEKAKAADFLTLNNILVTVMPQISTSVTVDDMLPFARNIHHFYIGETAGFPFDKKLADVGKLDCVIPVTLESNAVALHSFLYPDKAYEPSETLKKISAKIINDTGLGGSGETSVKTDAPSQGGEQAAPQPAGGGSETAAPETESVPEEPETDESIEETSEQETIGTLPDMTMPEEEPDYVVSPADENYVVTGNDGSSPEDAVVVAPADGASQSGSDETPAGPGGSSGSVTTSSDGPGSIGSGSGTSFSQDSPGSVSEAPAIETEAATEAAPAEPEAESAEDTEAES